VLGGEHFARSGRGDRGHRWQDLSHLGGIDATALHLFSAFAAEAELVRGQRATVEEPDEFTAIPELMPLVLVGCTVTIDAMGTRTANDEAKVIRFSLSGAASA
jgi:hypothetical protein